MTVQQIGIKIRGEKKKSQSDREMKTHVHLHMGIPVFLMH